MKEMGGTTITAESLELNLDEALRYMGFRGTPDEGTLKVVNELGDKLKKAIAPKHVLKRFSCSVGEEGTVSLPEITLKSSSLAKHLKGCEELCILAATLGTGADSLIRRYSVTDIAHASMLQAIGASLMETYCDRVQGALEQQMSAEGLYLKHRFSPGYGDLSMEHQRDIIRLLQTEKTIGLTLSESLMMIPTKSVTAIIGLSSQPCGHSADKCSRCPQTDCPYRKSGQRKEEVE